jgi:membrane fusion protein (multidrug efflux system)
VKAGEVLLTIGRKQGIDALIVSLQEELKKEEENLARIRILVDSDAIPGEQLDQAISAYEKVRAQMVQAEESARDYTITAPWEGVVSHVLVKEGEFVSPRSALIDMYDPSSLVINAAVPEKHAVGFMAGMQADVRLDAHPSDVFKGRIDRVYPYLDPRLRTRTIEIVLDKPVQLIPGMFARLNVPIETVKDAVTVPMEALVDTPKGRVVFLVEDGKVVGRPVVTGIEDGKNIQIVSGINPGDNIIVAGNEKLRDGMEVTLSGGNDAKKTSQGMGEKPPEPTTKPGGVR